MLRTILSFVLMVPVGWLLAGCGSDRSGGTAEVTVIASTTQVADLARNVAGDRAEVVGILAPGSDPHDYEPRPSDAEAIANADLVLESGGDVDLWLDELVDSSGSDAPVVTLLDLADPSEGAGEYSDGGHREDARADDERADDERADDERADDERADDERSPDQPDPHWWQDPTNAVTAVEGIRDALVDVDPPGRGRYRANADSFVADLERLDARIARCLDRVPNQERKLVTSHDALGYFADRYRIEVIGSTIPALTTQAQPSAGDTAELVDLIRDEDAMAVFPEVGVSTRLEQAIAEEAGAIVGGELWADALGPEGTEGETYIGAMAANATTMVEGFTGGAESCRITVE